MTAKTIMLVCATGAFGLGAANVSGAVNWLCLGLMFVTISWLV